MLCSNVTYSYFSYYSIFPFGLMVFLYKIPSVLHSSNCSTRQYRLSHCDLNLVQISGCSLASFVVITTLVLRACKYYCLSFYSMKWSEMVFFMLLKQLGSWTVFAIYLTVFKEWLTYLLVRWLVARVHSMYPSQCLVLGKRWLNINVIVCYMFKKKIFHSLQ